MAALAVRSSSKPSSINLSFSVASLALNVIAIGRPLVDSSVILYPISSGDPLVLMSVVTLKSDRIVLPKNHVATCLFGATVIFFL